MNKDCESVINVPTMVAPENGIITKLQAVFEELSSLEKMISTLEEVLAPFLLPSPIGINPAAEKFAARSPFGNDLGDVITIIITDRIRIKNILTRID